MPLIARTCVKWQLVQGSPEYRATKMAIASAECLHVVVWPDSDDYDDTVGRSNTGNVADINTNHIESSIAPKSDIACTESRPLTVGIDRAAMKRSVKLIWGERVAKNMGAGACRPHAFRG